MRTPDVDDFVRLTQGIPELSLHCGDVGVVCSTWCAPLVAYEVEFSPHGERRRTLLLAQQVEVIHDGPAHSWPDFSAGERSQHQ